VGLRPDVIDEEPIFKQMQTKKKKTRAATLARGEIKDTDLTVSSVSGQIVISNKKVTGDETDHPKSVKDDSF
jgi:hypothetical protein